MQLCFQVLNRPYFLTEHVWIVSSTLIGWYIEVSITVTEIRKKMTYEYCLKVCCLVFLLENFTGIEKLATVIEKTHI